MIMENLHVVWRRNPCGAVKSLEVRHGGTVLHDTAQEDRPGHAIESLLRAARDYYRADPYSDHLPPDSAVIAAYEEHVA